MVKEFNHNINFGLDILLHVFILYTFLTIFFFTYITNYEKTNIDNVTNNLINSNVSTILDNVKNATDKYNYKLDWKKLDSIALDLIENSKNEDPQVANNNKDLFRFSIITVSIFFVLIVGIFIYFKFFSDYEVDITHILITNSIVFLITGLIEFLFFMYIATKYIPESPDKISNTLLDRIKQDITS